MNGWEEKQNTSSVRETVYSKAMEINISVENSNKFELVNSEHKVFWVKWVKITTLRLKKIAVYYKWNIVRRTA